MTIPHPDASEAKLHITTLNKAAPAFGMEEYDPTFDARQSAAKFIEALALQLAEQRAEIERLKSDVVAARGNAEVAYSHWHNARDQLAAANARTARAAKVIDAIMHLTPHSVHIGYERTTSGNFSYEDAVLLSAIAAAARAWRNKEGT